MPLPADLPSKLFTHILHSWNHNYTTLLYISLLYIHTANGKEVLGTFIHNRALSKHLRAPGRGALCHRRPGQRCKFGRRATTGKSRISLTVCLYSKRRRA